MAKGNAKGRLAASVNEKNSRELVSGLLDSRAYNHETDAIHLKETHGAWVILTGPLAYKIKKPVNFGFLDYSTLEKRRRSCEEEVRLNRRFAPDIYLDVVAIRGTAGDPHVGGDGPVIEYAVKMFQFPEQGLLSDLADEGLLDERLIDQMIDEVAAFHQSTAVAQRGSRFGGPEQVRHWVVENFSHIKKSIARPAEVAAVEDLERWVHEQYDNIKPRLVYRKSNGFVRECHGDLHLGNMTVVNDEVVLFDCIEFNPELRWIDVISEVAFVVMDLDQRGLAEFSSRFLNGYLQHTGDYGGLYLLVWYLVYRALVRAKVAVLRSQQENSESALVLRLHADYLRYIQLAESYTRPRVPAMLLMHGLSGSGKTTAARWLCEQTGAIQIRSDIERKRLAGLAPLDRSGAMTGEGLYAAEQTERTYGRLLELAGDVLAAGYTVVVDAAFLVKGFRDRFRALAAAGRVPCVILTCRAPDHVLDERVIRRERLAADASEATLDVLAAQRKSSEALAADELMVSLQIDTDSMAYRRRLLAELPLLIKSSKDSKNR